MKQIHKPDDDRIDCIARNLLKNNVEYALSLERVKELYLKLAPLFMSGHDITLAECDRMDFREYFKQDASVRAMERQYFYEQGFADCITSLRGMDVIR